jgi:hypothetical protein
MKQAKKTFPLGVLTILISLSLISCNDSKSKKILGNWGYHYSKRIGGEYVGTVRIPKKTFSFDDTYTFENSGTGKYTYKSIMTSDDDANKNESYVIEYQMEWTSKNNGEEDFLIIKKNFGKIIDIIGNNKLKIEQDATELLRSETIDTLYYKLKNNNTMLVHSPNSKAETTFTRN